MTIDTKIGILGCLALMNCVGAAAGHPFSMLAALACGGVMLILHLGRKK